MRIQKITVSLFLSGALLMGCGSATDAGVPADAPESTPAAEVTETVQPETGNTAEPAGDSDTDALVTAIGDIGDYLSEANGYSSDAAEYIDKITNESDIGNIAYYIAQMSVRYGQMIPSIQKAITASEGIEGLETFRKEMNKTVEMFPEAVEIKSKDDAADYLTNAMSFLDQYRTGMEAWLAYLNSLLEE